MDAASRLNNQLLVGIPHKTDRKAIYRSIITNPEFIVNTSITAATKYEIAPMIVTFC